MATKLTYFSQNGLGEAIRYILHYNREEFEDFWIDRTEWPINSIKDALPYGQLPIYEEGDRKLNQSIAIARYVGHRAKLVPEDPWEQAQLDAAVLNVYDFIMTTKIYFRQGLSIFDFLIGYLESIYNKFTDIRPYRIETDPEKKKILLKEFLEVTVKYYFSRFEKELKEKNGHFGGKLSWADFYLLGVIENVNLFFDVKIESNYPTVTALIEKIRNLPGVKEYIASRRPYKIKKQ